ncbi:MAG: metallophosphoesterase, partial [Candidatus Krumholzibacteria bacterium]|nr:metallophosphoesterase [Candidatus Krumholzibacteria bacterium]
MRNLAHILITAFLLATLSTGCTSDEPAPSAPSGNKVPTANAGPDQAVVDTDESGDESVTLDGSLSTDSDGTIASYVWTEGATELATGAKPTFPFPTGDHTITLTVTDNEGATDTDNVSVTVSAPGQDLWPPTNFKVAFTGDTDHGSNAQKVFELVRDEGADMMLVAGDLSYGSVSEWTSLVTNVLGPDFPVFAAVGNHDVGDWSQYQNFLQARADHVGATWYGDYGVESTVIYKNMVFVILGAGTRGSTSNQEGFLTDELLRYDNLWEIACWHKNMNAMQVGSKGNETGWGVYENARAGGALIMTGHEHSYERTHVLSDMSSQTVADNTSPYLVKPGQTFATVSGLG